jgi:hypothetical protein
MSFYDHNGRDISDSLDRWITGNYGNDDPANRAAEPEELTLEDLADLARDRAEEQGEF